VIDLGHWLGTAPIEEEKPVGDVDNVSQIPDETSP
jgi:hypothetical protein